LSTPEAGRLARTDESQLAWAAENQWTLVTFNVGDFARLHHIWMNQGHHHSGLIVSQQRPVGDLLRRLQNIGNSLSDERMLDRLEYLSRWSAI